jgi:hypothetical protein
VLRKLQPGLSYANVTATLALAAALAGSAAASIPGPGGTIKGCYKKSNGSLRVIDSAKSCQSSEKALTWNTKGPPGPSDAFSGYHDTPVTVQGGFLDLARLDVPGGSYAVTVTALLNTPTPPSQDAFIGCYLKTLHGSFQTTWTALQAQQPGNAWSQGIALNIVDTNPGQITLTCGTSHPVQVSHILITAVRVNHITATKLM